jgi:putative oxidoreductase
MGGLMLTHGIPKLMQLLNGNFEFGDPIGIGNTASLILTVIGEAICPILVIIGLRTRIATIPTIIVMAVAAFVVHAADPIAVKEKALLYLVGFIVIAICGPGKFSIDRK